MDRGFLARAGLTARLLALVLPLVVLLTAATGWVILHGSRGVIDAFANLYGRTVADSSVELLRARALRPEEAVFGVARTIESLVVNGQGDRRLITDNLRRALESQHSILGTWFFAEPDAIGRDRDFVGGDLVLGHPKTGRFQAYYVRQGDSIVAPPTLPVMENEDWYALPKAGGRAMVISPYRYPVLGQDMLLSSFAVPVYAQGRLLGVAGFDLDMLTYAARLDQVHPLGGRVLLANVEGVWGYHPDHALLGAAIETGDDPTTQLTAEEMEAVRAVRPYVRDLAGVAGIDGPVRRFAAVLPYLEGEQRRLLIVDLPLGALLAPFERLKPVIAGASALAALTVLIVLHLAMTRIVGSPLRALRGAVARLNAGELETPVPQTGRRDEIGAIAQALDRFRVSLAERERLQRDLERAGAALQATQDAVVIFDSSFRVVAANPASARIVGAPGPDALVGRRWEELAGGDLSDERLHAPQMLHHRLATEGHIVGEYSGWISVYGRRLEVMQYSSSRLPSGDYVTLFRDVSELRRNEHERAELRARLLQQDKMDALGRLAGGIAHDFNNVLGAMMGYLDFLVSDLEPGAPGRDYASKALKVGARAKDLVRQILTFARGDRGDFSVLALSSVIDEARTILRSSVPASTRITFHEAHGTPAVQGNTTQLIQVVMNLVLNAHDARGHDAAHIAVRLCSGPCPSAADDNRPEVVVLPFDPARPHAVLEVEDDGRGMPPDTVGRLFEPFYTTKAMGKGTGLGMAVVYGIVKAHQGGLMLRSAEGRGTLVRILLPAAEGPVPRRHAPRDTAHPAGRGLRVLVVEDDAAMGEMLREGLIRRGHEVVLCRDADSALATIAADAERFDAVLTDQTMPGMSGLEFIERVKAADPGLVCALASGRGDSARAAAEAAGADLFFSKPADIADIVTRLEERLQATPAAS